MHQEREGCRRVWGVSTNAEQVAVWFGSFIISAHLDLAIEAMYCHVDARKSHLVEPRENARRRTSTKRKMKDGGRWTRRTRTLSM